MKKINTHYQISKRIFDIVFSAVAMVCLSPLFIIIAVGIRCSCTGKILYLQNRLGHQGKVFTCLKFRTMREDAEEHLKEILKTDKELKEEWDKNHKLQRDPRIFAFGKFLRKTSLDELPQLWNVLKGDLSLVGPRPYMVIQKKEMGEISAKILSVKPGLTGLWQTSGRSTTTFCERLHLDTVYIDKRSFWYDLVLICKTIPIVIFAKDAC